eukprot:GFUD01005613.1.p1 GENE.GFUD01005613.1~~GFUD01005613.1.p1  ORF type:complete len:872 (-),score=205.25 GFUD01005613.1:288-2903(-)
MDFIISRTKGLFQYGDIQGETRSSADVDSLDLETERSGIVSANASVRRRRRCVWIGSIVSGLVAIVIIAAAVKNRHHLQAAAEALVKSASEDKLEDSEAKPDHSPHVSKRGMTFDDFLRYKFYPSYFNGTWISDTEILFPDQFGGLSVNNVATSQIQTVVSHNQFLKIHPVLYQFSADRKYLLVKTLSQKVWRRSSFGSYGLIKMQGGRPATTDIIPLAPTNLGNDLDLNQFLRYVSWAPEGNAIAYVDYNNNIHYRHSAESEDLQLTNSGNDSLVYNGIPDWVSEEEVFEDNKALWWSPDGSKLVYGVFNDTLVEIVNLPRYGNWHNKHTNRQGYPFLQYFMMDQFRYPKSGTTNPTVTLWYADVGPPGSQNPITQQRLPPPPSMSDVEHHFTSISWRDDTTVAVIWMNRVQNLSTVAVCPLADNVKCQEVFVLPVRDGWVDYKLRVKFNKYKPSGQFLVILPASSMRFRYRQLFIIDTNGNSRTLLTKQEAEVTEVVEWTEDDQVYYIATLPGDPGARHLFKLQIGEPSNTCLTCNHQEMIPHLQHRPRCDFVSVSMSKGGSHYMMDCHGPGIPYSCLHTTQNNSLLSVWTGNNGLENIYNAIDSATVQYLEIGVEGSDQKAQVMLYLPPGVEREPGKKWPMLVEVYGGPGFQKVDKQWQGYGYPSYVAGSLGVVYAVIDPRGSGFQGDAWRHAVYRQFGSVEVTDTISVTKHLQENLDYIDASRTAIWGWSYGGFLSLSALTKDTSGVFKCGASVAPVVKWELYDTIYTERYMSTPQDNPGGYNSSTPLWGLENLRHKKYYVIHGTHDDNVHYQQSMLLSAALEEKDILFRQQSYPDQDHSIQNYRRHLYHSLSNFFTEDCFGMPGDW